MPDDFLDAVVFRKWFGRAHFKNMFSSAPPPPPTPLPPPTMPDPFGPAQLEARRKATATAAAGGRNATILTTTASRAGQTIAGNAFAGVKAGG